MSTPRSVTLPPGVRRVTVATARGEFAAIEARPPAGAEEVRPPALLVPGYTGSKEDFTAIMVPLAATGRRVVAVDLRGQYETPGPDDPAAYRCDQLAADVLALQEAVLAQDAAAGSRLHLVGHSFGGLVGREAVLASPDRHLSFTLMNSGPGMIRGQREELCRRLLALLPRVGLTHIWDNELEPDAVRNGAPPDVVAFLKRRMFANSLTGLVAMAQELLSCPDRVAELATVEVPKLVLYGEHDDAWPPAEQAEMAARLAAAEAVIPRAAHSPAVEAPALTANALIGFWREAERSWQDGERGASEAGRR